MVHVQDRIQALLTGELDAAGQAAVASHLAECPACAEAVAEASRLWELLGEVAALPEASVASAWPAVRARTIGARASRMLPGAGPWSRAGLAGAALAAGLGMAVLLPVASEEQAVEPAVAAGAEPVAAEAGDLSTLGGAFWLEETSGLTISDMWLTAAGGSGS